MVGRAGDITEKTIARGIEYIRSHPEIRDVLLSGGDPLMLSDGKLEHIIASLRAIPSVEIVRIGTRIPCVLPSRITDELCSMLRKYHPIFLNTHFNHPREITPASRAACERLANAGIPVGCQTVLMKGVNDDPETMKELMHKLLLMRVRPYYLYQADLTRGTNHFRTRVEVGLEIIKALRGHTTGFAVPQFAIDAPGGGGKIPLLPEYVLTPGRERSGDAQLRGEAVPLPPGRCGCRGRRAGSPRHQLLARVRGCKPHTRAVAMAGDG